jgi:hypothetical protein
MIYLLDNLRISDTVPIRFGVALRQARQGGS